MGNLVEHPAYRARRIFCEHQSALVADEVAKCAYSIELTFFDRRGLSNGLVPINEGNTYISRKALCEVLAVRRQSLLDWDLPYPVLRRGVVCWRPRQLIEYCMGWHKYGVSPQDQDVIAEIRMDRMSFVGTLQRLRFDECVTWLCFRVGASHPGDLRRLSKRYTASQERYNAAAEAFFDTHRNDVK